MGGACSAQGGDDKMHSALESLKGRENSGDKCECEDNIKIDSKEMGRECVDCSHLLQGRYQLQALIHTVIKLFSVKGVKCYYVNYCQLLNRSRVPWH